MDRNEISTVSPTESISTTSLAEQVTLQQVRRRDESATLQREGKTLHEALLHFDNDYMLIDKYYESKTGVSLISDPYTAAEHPVPITKTCSIVIPAYNSADQLRRTLDGIQASSFNAKYPQQLEVIIVDDGSPRVDVAKQVKAMELEDLTVKVFRESRGRECKARYSGALQAKGDIILFTAQDVVYSPTMIEEYMKRHQVLDDVVFFGMRQDIDQDDPNIQPQQIQDGSLIDLPYNFEEDVRVRAEGMRDSDWLKQGGNNKTLPIDVEDDRFYGWTVPSVAYGFSVSAPREAIIKTFGGYDARYTGFGGDDEHMVSDLIAEGMYVIPNVAGIGYHQRHPSRWSSEESAVNRRVWQERLRSPVWRQDSQNPQPTDAVLLYETTNVRTASLDPKPLQADSITRARTLSHMGMYEEAIHLFDQVEDKEDIWFLHDRAVTLTKMGGTENVEAAKTALEQSTQRDPENSALRVSLAVAYGRLGLYSQCLEEYTKVLHLDPANPDAQVIAPLDGDEFIRAEALHEKGKLFLTRGKPGEALIYYEAALALVGQELTPWSLLDKGIALARQGHYQEALDVLTQGQGYLPNTPWIDYEMGLIYQELGDQEQARVHLQKAAEKDLNKPLEG